MGYRVPLQATRFPSTGRSHSHHLRHRSGNDPDTYSPSKSHFESRQVALNNTNLLAGAGSEQQAGYTNVWRWLSETGNRGKYYQADEESRRNRIKKSRHRYHLHDSTRPEELTWLPHHITPATNEPLRSMRLTSNQQGKHRRQRPTSVDSSIISDFQAHRDPPRERRAVISVPTYSISSVGPDERLSITQNSSPPIPQAVGSPRFEKMPRHKTKEDKYDTKKRKRRQSHDSSGESRRKMRQNTEKRKRKAIALSKNVMNNFTSKAVTNDRITIQPHLKPGLFDNGRVSRKPISDLAFSEMQFLQHQKRHSQPKQLSKSRLRERQRESRELEELSAFFLPSKTNGDREKPNRSERRDHADPMSPSIHHNHQNDLESGNEPSEPSKDKHKVITKYHHSSSSARGLVSRESEPGNREFPHTVTNPSKATSYFTWSRSETSPLDQVPDDTRSGSLNPTSEWTTTPNSIRRALVATGIYRDTGIQPYDDATTIRKRPEHTIQEASCSSKHSRTLEHGFNRQKESNIYPKKVYCDQAIMTDDKLDSAETHRNQCECNKEGKQTEYDQTSPSYEGVDPGRNTRETRLPSNQSSTMGKATKTGSTTEAQTYLGFEPLNQEAVLPHARQTSGSEDRVSQSSREAMPPPPLPFHRRDVHPVSLLSHSPVEDLLSQDNTRGVLLQQPLVNELHEYPKDNSVVNSSTPSIKPSVGAYGSVCSPRSFSWIPQVRTPSAVGSKSRSPFLRLSMRSPLYQSQLDGNQSEDLQRVDNLANDPEETLSDFIARIEEEMQEQAHLQSIGFIEEEAGVYDTTESPSQQGQYLGHAMGHEDEDAGYLTALINPEGVDHGVGCHQSRETGRMRPSQSELGITTKFEDGLEDEQMEMSSFWKLNGFSHF